MPTVTPPADPKSDPRVKAVFDDIRTTRRTTSSNLWRYLAVDPALLETTWRDVKSVMATPSTLDPMTKELIHAAVSIANSCSCCVHSLNAAARAKGMSDAQYTEFLSIVSPAARTNHLLNGMQIPIDPAFDAHHA